MHADTRMPRVTRRNRILLGALVVLLVAGGLVLWPAVRAMTTAGASGQQSQQSLPILDTGVRFRIVGQAVATPDPNVFTSSSFVVPNNRAVKITNVVLQNPHADTGTMRILIGNEVILEESLANLRDQHYPIPLHVKAGQPVVVAVNCALPGPPEPANGKCAPSASFFG
jgi:hypothetical protein